MTRTESRRPLVLAGVTAVVSAMVLAVALWLGLLGDDIGRGSNFCEAARNSLVKQPANTWSNLGFVIAGLAIARHIGLQRPSHEVLTRGRGTAYACVVVFLGPGSAAMHASQSDLGGRLDMLSMYLVASFAAAYGLGRLLRRPTWCAPMFVVFVVGCELIARISTPVPLVAFTGNLAFAALLLTAMVAEVTIAGRPQVRIDLRWGLAAVAVLLVAFGIWIAGQRGLCDPHSLLQAHAVWHLLDALAAYLLYRLWASERSVDDGAGAD